MPMSTAVIDAAEESLRQAMLQNDVRALGDLLSAGLVFTDHNGQRLSKTDGIVKHSSGFCTLDRLDVEDREIRFLGACAVVTQIVSIAGNHNGEPFAGRYAYTRVWEERDGRYVVAIGHCSAIA